MPPTPRPGKRATQSVVVMPGFGGRIQLVTGASFGFLHRIVGDTVTNLSDGPSGVLGSPHTGAANTVSNPVHKGRGCGYGCGGYSGTRSFRWWW
mmetsp:Transcript_2513/g.2906  ORF Transcript_2513/g.2906 Transcript_2513/m.2906 type:complete len:94 (+) Transcript_2513:150-431(+)